MAQSSTAPELKIQPSAAEIAERYRCGTLQYTKFGLIALFSWMIWGNICFNLFETQGGYTILNLYLQDNFHVSNLTVNVLFNVIPMVIGTFMTPIISFKSDRTRSRWGRRIPYILFTAPFLAGFAAAIGFSDDIILYCKATFPETGIVNPFTVALAIIGFMTIGYSFFNEFVGTVYYYLLPDVMPRHFIGRFQGVSTMVGQVSGIFVGTCIVPYQLTHLKTIQVSLATLYFVGLGMVCLFVKEGQYPPVEDVGEKTTFGDQVRLYFRECFTHPIFVLLYLSTACTVLTKGLNPAGVFHLHLSEHQAKVQVYADTKAPAPAPANVPTAEANSSSATPQVPSLIMAMTPDGKIAVSNYELKQICVWDTSIKIPSRIKTIPTRDGAITAVAVTADGKTAICGSQAGTIEMLDIASGQPQRQLTGHTGTVRALAVSKDTRRLASTSADKTIRVWDLANGTCLQTLAGHDDQVNCVAFSSDASKVVSGGADKKIIIWDVKQGTALKTLQGSPGPVYTITFAPALGPVSKQDMPVKSWLATKMHTVGFFLQQVFTNESLYDVPVDETSALVAEDGWVISGGRDQAKDNLNSFVRIWDVAKGEAIRSLKGHKSAISSIVYKPDLRVILSSGLDGSVRLWKPWSISEQATDQSYKTMSGYTHGITSMNVTDTGTKLVNASEDGTLHVWNIDTGVSLARGGLRTVFFSIVGFCLAYPIGSLVDRWNPIKIVLFCSFLALPFPLFYFLWYHSYTFSLYAELIRWPIATLGAMASVPMMIMLYPKTKYGQFSSANALVRQAVAAVAGPLGAIIMDSLTRRSLDTDYFRYGYLFQFIALSCSYLAMLVVYYHWKKLGGDKYSAPEA